MLPFAKTVALCLCCSAFVNGEYKREYGYVLPLEPLATMLVVLFVMLAHQLSHDVLFNGRGSVEGYPDQTEYLQGRLVLYAGCSTTQHEVEVLTASLLQDLVSRWQPSWFCLASASALAACVCASSVPHSSR